MIRCAAALILAAAWFIGPAQAQDVVGYIKTVEGDAVLVIEGVDEEAVPGDALTVDDIVRTGADGSVGIALTDNSRIALGPNSAFHVSDYVFEPDRGAYALVGNMSKGTMVFASGLIGKLAPGEARVDTPAGTIGIRGTRFLLRVSETP